MAFRPIQLFTLLLIVLVAVGTQTAFAARLLAYYPHWNPDYRAINIPYNKLTHICHAFLIPAADASLTVPANFMEPNLLTLAHQNNVRVLVSIGGAGQSSAFTTIAASGTLRTAFANNVYNFIRNNNYDGVDIDWEYPESFAHRGQLNALIGAIRAKFNASPSPAPTWQISLAVPGGNWFGQWFDYQYLYRQANFLNIMTYDFHGSWSGHSGHNSPLYAGNDILADGSMRDALDYMINTRGVPAAKINAGVPFYGYKFTNSETLYDSCNGNCATVYMPYKQIAPLVGNGWTSTWDSSSSVPYLRYNSGTGLITYDNPNSITMKVNYALDTRGVGGVFMWDLSQDKVASGGQPLLIAMYNAKMS